jgi:hypothetical protein
MEADRSGPSIWVPMTGALEDLVAAELSQPVDRRVSDMAAALAARYPGAARAVLFYGSCLRTPDLEGQMLDFYLLVSDYRSAYGKSWMAPANRLIPPNVFPFQHGRLAAKYAVLSEADFDRLNGARGKSVSVWARFAQPSRLAWSVDEDAARACAKAVAKAAPTLLAAARPMLIPAPRDPLDLWREAFTLTYSAELRAERKGRAASVVEGDPARYLRFTAPALEAAGIGTLAPGGGLALKPVSRAEHGQAKRDWAKRRRAGKLLSALRLTKASGTYAGGVDYLAWKINRHAGTKITIAPWQRRWPLLAAITLLPRLLKQRAIR